MELQELKVSMRRQNGTGAARKIRQEGNVPLVLYGGGKEPVGLTVDGRKFGNLLHGKGGEHAVVQLDVADNSELNTPALIKEVQHHKVHGQVIHADLLRIRLDEKIHTAVSVHLVGHAVGVVEGGVIDHMLREIEVECLALEVPDFFEADVTELNIGDSLRVSDLVVPENITVLTDSERALVAVHAPRVIEEPEPEEVEGEEAIEGEEGAEATEEGGEEKPKEESKEEKSK